MTKTRVYSYPALLEEGENQGVFVVTFPDVPEAITEGDGEAHALVMGRDALGTALLALLALRRPIPDPSRRSSISQPMISVAADVAAKIAVIEAFQDAGITQAELGKLLGKDGREVRRILSPTHATKLPALQEALEALGRRLVVSVEAA